MDSTGKIPLVKLQKNLKMKSSKINYETYKAISSVFVNFSVQNFVRRVDSSEILSSSLSIWRLCHSPIQYVVMGRIS